ncbi:MAG: two-component regulator propeller domain-containing protein [Bacteroidota bacterium]|nr:two-component regulator propeller domain-containing protein [Bacteroidota bacterium]
MIYKPLAAILWGLIFSSFLLAQPVSYDFLRIGNEQGLSNNQITSIFKDKQGFMWFGTISGLNRFDGYKFKIFRNNPQNANSIIDNSIGNIIENYDGKLWVQTSSGFNLYDPQIETFNRDILSLSHKLSLYHSNISNISNIFKDRQNNMWYAVPSLGLYKYIPSTNKSIHISHLKGDTSSLYSNDISGMGQDDKGNYWIIYDDGVFEKLDEKNNKIIYRNTALRNIYKAQRNKFEVKVDSRNDVWIWLKNYPGGLYYYNPISKLFLHFNQNSGTFKLNNNIVSAVEEDTHGKIWVGTDHGGINIINKKNFSIQYFTNNESPNSLSQNSITSIYKDNGGTMWVGTFKNGISYYHDDITKFKHFSHIASDANSLSFDDINCYAEDDKGNLWIGSNGGGLIYYDRQHETFKQFKNESGNANSLSNNVIVSLLMDKQHHLWIGTYTGGLNCFDGKRFIRYQHDPSKPNSLADDRIMKIFEDSKGNLWIGTLSAGLDRFDRQTGTFYHYTKGGLNSIQSNFVPVITEDKEGNLWLGSLDGIDILDKNLKQIKSFVARSNNSKGLSNFNVTDILNDSRGLMWVATRNGLNLYDKTTRKFRSFTEKDGLPDNTIISMLEDNNGNLWLATLNGISNLVITAQTNKKGYLVSFNNFDQADGLQGKEFNGNSAFKTRTGELIFGGANGFNIFRPEDVKTILNHPKVILTDFLLFNQSVPIGRDTEGRLILDEPISQTSEITLKYQENIFSIEFSALNYFFPEKDQYRYMLEGFDHDWITTDGKNNRITYTNLDPGEYIFKVKAASNDGQWNNPETRLSIKILPPWWRSWWLYFIVLVIVVTLVYSIYFLRLTIYRNQQANLTKLVKQRTHELLQTNELLLDRQTKIEEQSEELKAQTESLKKINDLLLDKQKVIQSQADELQKTNQELSLQMSTKDRLLSIIAHDLRNPFHVVGGFAEVLQRDLNKLPEDKVRRFLALMQSSTMNANNLLENLLQWTRTQTGRISFNPKNLNLHKLVQETIDVMEAEASRKNIGFNINIDPSLNTMADENMLRTILRNLISNAIKFSFENGQISIAAQIINNETEIVVSDNGTGISPENQKCLFHLDTNISTEGTMKEKGTGLGLILCSEFVEKHNGKIWVVSEPEKGSEFRFTLPFSINSTDN